MRKVNAIIMDWNEFQTIIENASNGEASIEAEGTEWFYVSTENYNADNIENDIADYLHINIKTIIIDITKEDSDVVIVLE